MGLAARGFYFAAEAAGMMIHVFWIFEAGSIVLATVIAQAVDGSGGAKTQVFVAATAALVCIQIGLQWARDRQKRKWDEQDRVRKEAAEKQAAIDRQQLKDNVQAVHTRAEAIAEKTQAVETELARNTEITKQAAQAVTDGFKDSVANSLRAAFNERFGESDPTKTNPVAPDAAADANKPKG